jgi:ankyrin repeat protein
MIFFKFFLRKASLCFVFIGLFVFASPAAAQVGVYDQFFTAVRRDNAQAVEKLLAIGFDANTLDPQKRTGLMLAIAEKSTKVASFLISTLNIDLEALNTAGENALMLASISGQEALVRQLIERGAEVNKPGWTALHYAASGGHDKIVRLLLDNHAFVDAESPNGSTPLMLAAQYGSTATVKMLLEEGAQADQQNQQGLNALDFANRGQRPDAIALLNALLRPRQYKPARR